MRISKKVTALGLALGVAIGGVLVAAPANAEPVSSGYVLVGSDTLQDSINALANGSSLTGSSVRVTAAGNPLGNYDAFGSAGIQTRPGGTVFGRPSGSGAGITALRASITGANYSGNAGVPARPINAQVDIARSSSGPGANANSNGQLAYYPYGRDAVAYAFTGDPAALGNLTTAQLRQIYEANSPVTINGVQVSARIPQSTSGTRSFFLSAIGVTQLGSTVPDGASNLMPENDGSVLTGTTNTIIPFSAASWIAQRNGASGVNTIPAGVTLGNPNGVSPTTGTTTLAANAEFYGTTYGRDTYVVVEYARVNPGNARYDANLAALVDRTRALSLTNFSASPSSAGAVKSRFGFLAPTNTTPIRAYATL